MFIKEYEAVNFCQHEHLCWQFKPGVTGILGPNGAGKSNALLGLYYALTNDTSRNAGVKSSNIRQGIGPNDKSYVRISLSHDGTDFEIQRGLKNAKNLLTIGNRSFIKDAEITEELEKIFQMPGIKKVMDDFVFVEQGQLVRFVSDNETARAQLLQQISGTDRIEALWDLLKNVIAEERRNTVLPHGVRDDLVRELRDANVEALAAKAEVLRERKNLLKKEIFIKAKKDFANCQKRISVSKDISKWNDEIVKFRGIYVELIQKCDELESKLGTYQAVEQREAEEVVRAEKFLSEEKVREDRLTTRDRLQEEHSNHKKRISKIKKQLVDLEDSEGKKAWERSASGELPSSCGELAQRLSYYRGLITKAATGSCPLCGTAGKDWPKPLTEIVRETEALQEEFNECSKNMHISLKYTQEKAKLESDLKLSRAARDQVEAKLTENMSGVHDLSEDHAAMKEKFLTTIREYKEWKDKVLKTKYDLEAKTTLKIQAEERLNEVVTRRDEARKWLKSTESLKGRSKEFSTLLEKHRAARVIVKSAKSRRLAAESNLSKCRERLAVFDEAVEKVQKAVKWCELLEEARGVFHRECLPRIAHQTTLENIEEEVNKTLETFLTPFRVKADQKLTFAAKFTDGRLVPDSRLSKGQQSVLSIGFRVAVNDLWATNLGLLVLDEPTEHLDDHHVGCLEPVFTALHNSAKERRAQILIVTHDTRVARFFDQTITLSALPVKKGKKG